MSKKNKTSDKKITAQKKGDNQSVTTLQNKPALWLAAVFIITFFTYLPSLKNGYTNWDDNVYIGENVLIKSMSSKNIKQIFDTDNHVSLNYHPITILSLAIDYKLAGGYSAKQFHKTNFIFHLLNTVFVFCFIYLLSDKRIWVATIVSLFFGIHPMHVESVAWISERKDVLYVFFLMAGLVSYIKYISDSEKNKIAFYILTLLFFVCAVLSKAMAVVMPVLFVLVDYYKGRKLDKISILEKLPFFILALLFGMLASRIQAEGAAIAKFETFTFIQRIMFASYGFLGYIYKLFLPFQLSCFYPYPHLLGDRLPILFYVAPFVVVALFALAAFMFKKNKAFVFGFLFYFFAVALVLQFVSVGQVIMADRYSYLSYIGLLFPIAIGFDWLQQQSDDRFKIYKQVSVPLLIVLTVGSVYLSVQRINVWKNSDALWSDAIKKYPDSESAYRNRGSYLINKVAYDLDYKTPGAMETERALADFNISIQLNPNSAKVFTNRANIHGLKGQFDLALQDYSSAIRLDSSDEQTFFNRAVTYSMMKQFDKAIEDYTTALKIKPDFTTAKQSRAFAYVDNRNFTQAITELNELIKSNPENFNNYFYRGTAYFNSGNAQKAIDDYTETIKLSPNYAGAFFNRSVIYNSINQHKPALEDALKAEALGYPVSKNYINDLQRKNK